jgi:hypothetical protein
MDRPGYTYWLRRPRNATLNVGFNAAIEDRQAAIDDSEDQMLEQLPGIEHALRNAQSIDALLVTLEKFGVEVSDIVPGNELQDEIAAGNKEAVRNKLLRGLEKMRIDLSGHAIPKGYDPNDVLGHPWRKIGLGGNSFSRK